MLGASPEFPAFSYIPYHTSYVFIVFAILSRCSKGVKAFKHTDQEVIDFYARSASTPIPGVPKFDSRRLVDGQRYIEFLKPLPPTSAGGKFELRSKVLGVYDKGKAGTVVETETLLVEKGGDVFTRAVGSGFFVGQGIWGGPKGGFNAHLIVTSALIPCRPEYGELPRPQR